MSIDTGSLSSRRAWIEMLRRTLVTRFRTSLSSRRAWIEISTVIAKRIRVMVALLTESVD